MSKESVKTDMSQGIANPPQVNATASTIILRPTEKQYVDQQVNSGKMSYAQNINVQNDKYGRSIVLPGPYVSNFTTTSAGIYMKAVNISGDRIYLGNTTNATIDQIYSVGAGETPTYQGNHLSVTTTAAGLVDMSEGLAGGLSTAGVYVDYIAGGVAYVQLLNGVQGQSSTFTLSTPTAGSPLPILRALFDGNMYIGNSQIIDKIDTSVSFTTQGSVHKAAVGSSGQAVPYPWFITALGEWNGNIVAACCDTSPGDFSQRNADAHSRLFFWDLANYPNNQFKNINLNSPSHYISTLITDLSGNLLAFGGVDEGRTTIYQFNGYGFEAIFSYIGDMPRSRHSVCFDSVGRLVWVTADSKLCRWDRANDIFDYLGVVGATANNGGICTNFQTAGYDFLTAGDGWVSTIDLRGFVTGGSGSSDTITRPLAISDLMQIPQQSVITNVTPTLHKALETGEKIEVRLYPSNYDLSTYTVLGSLDFTQDGAITSKNVRTLQSGQTSFSIGYAWQTTVTTTAPGIVGTNVEYNKITTL